MVRQTLRHLPPSLRFLLWVVGLNVVLFSAFRAGFWLVFRSGAPEASAGDILHAFYLGLKFDLRLALLACLPPLALALVPWLRPSRNPLVRRLWLAYFVAAFALAALLYLVDLGHYGYVRQRLNASLIEHLQPVGIAARMAWETYPVLWGFALVALLASGYLWLLRRWALPELAREAAPLGAWTRRALLALVLALYSLGLYGKWSWYPLRWSEAYTTRNEFLAALALNPILFLADTYGNRAAGYDIALVRKHYPRVAQLLGVERPDAQRLSYERWAAPRAAAGGARRGAPLNLVVIHLESFAGFKAGAFGNRLPGTPHFDALAREGLLFTNFFVPSVPTARSVFTMLTGTPDYNPGRSASRNPLVVSQHTLVNALEGRERLYFINGSATWGNIRGILQKNIDRLQVYEEGSYAAGQVDTWGVTDLVLFDKALAVMNAQAKPFFAFIQTSGNHRPYTIPEDDRRGFELAQADEAALRENGFDSLAAYNGLRYFDHALGLFFREARKQPWFANTLFVLYGDHGNPSAKPTAWERLYLTSFHVPLVYYAPGLIREGRRIDAIASQVDLLPTALGLMQVPYRNTTLGRDLLAPRTAAERFALIPGGILDDEFLLHFAPGPPGLYPYRAANATEDQRAARPEAAAALRELHEAFYQTSLYLLQHNPPRPHRPDPG